MAGESREREEDGAEETRLVRPRSSVSTLPRCVIGLAYRNRKHRFFVPATSNNFAGIPFSFVMVDSGCNSFLLPFPQREKDDGTFEIDMGALEPFLGHQFRWSISGSSGTGAVGSKTLRIENRNNSVSVGSMQLACSSPVPLDYLRFHLGSEAANALKNHAKVLPDHRQALQDFLTALNGQVSKERKHVLLGQYYLDQVCCIQRGSVMFMVDRDIRDPINIAQVANQCDEFAYPLVGNFDGFDDLEDEDHDGDDNENRRLSWDPTDYIDEAD
ncbi:expressed unknown protein [Seminavis robusta]|uniref:Uncharacterized protein n=1 Tax=Seminavis robusta TaxID=568900 RepID=A0A9N8HWC1_9STRA|nr:expressed unknown protein [Seminavis robusta]|eukprot:Sro2143_g316230.1 n/a (272) ;mRNA; f:436-1251